MTFDFEPEDAWDIGDTVRQQIRNLGTVSPCSTVAPPGSDSTTIEMPRRLMADRHPDPDDDPGRHYRAGLLAHDIASYGPDYELTEGMADWLRDAGLSVVEYEGWPTRAAFVGGYAPGDRGG